MGGLVMLRAALGYSGLFSQPSIFSSTRIARVACFASQGAADLSVAQDGDG
jgi:hypothetical protein